MKKINKKMKKINRSGEIRTHDPKISSLELLPLGYEIY